MQPFKVGQKVVPIKNMSPLKKGDIVTVADCFQCPKCKEWYVTILELTSIGVFNCSKDGCNTQITGYPQNKNCGGQAKYFAPLEETKERIRYVAVSETLRETAVEIAAVETN